MNKRDIAEIKRRFNWEHNNITSICGCYISKDGEVISTFEHPMVGMAQDEAEKYLAIFKRTLSGTQGQNLLDIEFSAQQVLEGDHQKELMALVATALKDEGLVQAFFEKIRTSLTMADHYLVLLMHDGYDIPHRSANDEKQQELSTEVFHYILCSVCPVKLTKPTLTYHAANRDFYSRESDWIVGVPEMGFLYPAYESRSADLYHALYYTRDTAENHEDFVQAVFASSLPMPADLQRESFQSILQETLGEECRFEVMQSLQENITERMAQQSEDKSAPPLTLTKQDVTDLLLTAEVTPEKVAAFEEKYEETFGTMEAISAVNVAGAKKFEVKTPFVTVQVAPEAAHLVESRIIDGCPCVVIRAAEGVEVNGVSVVI